MNPEVPWRPARWLTTEFVQPNNIAVKEQSDLLKKLAHTDDDYIRICANFVRDSFVYPLQKDKDPSAGLCLLRYDDGGLCKKYYFKQEMPYAWGFPNETLKIKKGICIDTALLFTSLLIAGGISAKCCLGAIVNTADNSVSGYHAWSTFMYQGERCANETTIHTKAETINRITSLYNRTSDWANSTGIYYKEEAQFDQNGYEGTGALGGDMVCLMGLTPQRVECFGLQDALTRMDVKRKSMAKEWRKSEAIKEKILSEAYGGV